MEFYEIRAIMKYQYYAHKDNWEQARLIAYMIGQTNSKNKLKISDIIEFPWDSEENENVSVSNEEITNLRQEAQKVASMMNSILMDDKNKD